MSVVARDLEPDPVAVDIVVRDRIRMPLKGPDRVEAIRLLAAKGLLAREIALLVKVSMETVQRSAKKHDIPLRGIEPAHWSVAYVEASRDPVNRRRWKNGDFTAPQRPQEE